MTQRLDAILTEILAASRNHAVAVRAQTQAKTRKGRRKSRVKRRADHKAAQTVRQSATAQSASMTLRGSIVAWLSRHDQRLAPIINDNIVDVGEKVILNFNSEVTKSLQTLRDLREIATRCGFKMNLICKGHAVRFSK
jgi:hypothetical protein